MYTNPNTLFYRRSIEQIRRAIAANDFLNNMMDKERLQAVIDAMKPTDYKKGSFIIREGDSGSHLYVSAYGQFEVLKAGQVIKKFGPGEAFGELAILYKAKRFASITCKFIKVNNNLHSFIINDYKRTYKAELVYNIAFVMQTHMKIRNRLHYTQINKHNSPQS